MTTRKSGSGVPRVDVGTQNVARYLAHALENQNALSRDLPGLAPLGNSALKNSELARNGALATRGFHRFLHKIFPHDPKYITEIDIESNAKSDSDPCHSPAMNAPPTKTTFWDRIVEAAVANGIGPTQEAIADALGIRQSAVAKWKAGGRPRTKRLEEIARKWRYNLNWLLNEEGPKRPAGVGETDEIAEMLQILKTLNPSNRRVLLSMAKEIRKGQITASREREPA